MLFMPQDLAQFIHVPVQAEAGFMAERVAWGWLRPVLGLDERPDPVPDEVFAWAIELGAIAHENPDGKASYQAGPFGANYSADRRAEILAEAGAYAGTVGGVNAAGPMGSFPDAVALPDPPMVRL